MGENLISNSVAVKLKFDRALSNRHLKRSLILLSAFILYLIASLIFFAPGSVSDLSHTIFNDGGDPQQFVWYYNWWPFALSHHLNPFISKYVWYPKGYNIAWSTSIATLALIMAPITLIGGAILSFNLVALLSPVLAALSCFALVYYLTKSYLPALMGGYIYGFSSYELGQLLGHPQLYVILLLPLLVLLFLLVYRQRIKPLTFVILSAVVLALQLGICLEIFATFLLFSLLSWVVFYWSKAANRKQLLTTGKYTLYAIALCLILASPYIYYLIKGFSAVPSTIHPLSAFSTDLANLFIPTTNTLIGGGSLARLSRHFAGNTSENGAYLGLPLLLILLFVTIRYWKNRVTRALIITLIVIGIASLGPRLHLIGKVGELIILPWAIFDKLPFIKSALPDRFSLYFYLLTAIIVSLWLSDKPKNKKHNRLKYAAVAVGILCLLPRPSQYSWSKPSLPILFQKQNLAKYLTNKPNLLVLPFNQGSMYYQSDSNMAFTQTGGYAGFTPMSYRNNPVVLAMSKGTAPTGFAKSFAKFCTINKVNYVIYIKNITPTSEISAISSLHWPEVKVGNSIIVSVI